MMMVSFYGNGNGGASSSQSEQNSKIIEQNETIISLLEKISLQRGEWNTETDPYVDGSRLSRIASRYIGMGSYRYR